MLWVSIWWATAAPPVSATRAAAGAEHIAAIDEGDLHVAAVLSGNRNFEGRVSPQTRLNYLASPPLVVAYALAGNVTMDLLNDPLGTGSDGEPVFLKDVWPSNHEVESLMGSSLTPEMFRARYDNVFDGSGGVAGHRDRGGA